MAAVPQTCCYTKVVCSTSARLFHIWQRILQLSRKESYWNDFEFHWSSVQTLIIIRMAVRRAPNHFNHLFIYATTHPEKNLPTASKLGVSWKPGARAIAQAGNDCPPNRTFFKCFTDIYRLCIHHFICFIDLTVYASLWQYNVPCLGWKLGYLSFLLLSSYLTGCIWFSLSTPRCRFDKLYLIPYFG